MTYPPPQQPQDPHQPPVVSGPPYQQQPVYPQPPYPQQPYAYPAPPPVRPVNPRLAYWTSGTGIVLMLVIAGVAVVLLAGVVNLISGPASDNFDVSVTSCDATGSSSLATATVGFTVKNTSKTTRDATLRIEYRDGSGSRLDTDTAYVRDIRAGDTVRGEESTILDAAPPGSISCEITGIK